ncbi:MAG: lysophospholipid acyltransferase family protein [Phycisphaerales bacterium]
MEVRSLFLWLAVGAAAYAATVLVWSWVIMAWLRSLMSSGPIDGALSILVRLWLRLFHHPTWIGWEQLPNRWRRVTPPEPDHGLIVVANHASGVDPFVLQMQLRHRIRWMMSEDQMIPAFANVWKHLEVLPVRYTADDAATFREAVRHVRAGGVLGIFPEGGIARPPNEVRPFLPGVGVLVARSKTPVLVAWIEGAPEAPNARVSLFKQSHVRAHCLGVVDFAGQRDSSEILRRLRQMILDASGWPANDEPLPSAAPPTAGR